MRQPFASLSLAHSPAVGPYALGTVQRRAALFAGRFLKAAGARDGWRSVEVLVRRIACRSHEYSARSRCYSKYANGEQETNNNNHMQQKAQGRRTKKEGRSPFVNSNTA